MNFAFLSSVVAALIGLSLIFLTPLSIWDSLNIVGPALVLIGITREFWLLINKLPKDSPADAEAKKHRQEVVAALVVIVGVALELIVVPRSLFETADLKLRTVELEATNVAMWQTNAVLRRSLVTLELQIQPRIITPEKVTNFIWLTEKIKKIPLTVSIGQEGFDTETFAVQLRTMLGDAGFGTNEGSGILGIKRDPDRISWKRIGYQVQNANLVWVVPSNEILTNAIAETFVYETVNGFKQPIVTSTNEVEVYGAVIFVLQQLDIQVYPIAGEGWRGIQRCEFFVPVKSQF